MTITGIAVLIGTFLAFVGAVTLTYRCVAWIAYRSAGTVFALRGMAPGSLPIRQRAAADFLIYVGGLRLEPNEDGADDVRLLAFKQDFRNLIAERPIQGLAWCLVHGNVETQRLAIWLLGRCGGRSAAGRVARFSRHPWAPIRKEAAQALRRLESWAELRRMLASEQAAEVRRAGAELPPAPFNERLQRFLREPPRPAATLKPGGRSEMEFFSRVALDGGRPPKSPALIRRILERIRRLVHGPRIGLATPRRESRRRWSR